MLNLRTTQPFEEVLEDLGQVLKMSGAKRMYTITGQEVYLPLFSLLMSSTKYFENVGPSSRINVMVVFFIAGAKFFTAEKRVCRCGDILFGHWNGGSRFKSRHKCPTANRITDKKVYTFSLI